MRVKYRPKPNLKTIKGRFLDSMWDIIEFHRETNSEIIDVKSFAESIGMTATGFTRYEGTLAVTTKILQRACAKYRINPTYVILGEGERFLDHSFRTNAIEKKIKDLNELKKKIK